MSKIKSFEVKDSLLKKIEDYIEKNGYTFSEFIRMCIHTFLNTINQPKNKFKSKKKEIIL